MAKGNPTELQELQQEACLLFRKFTIGRANMSKSPIAFLLLKRIGKYLEHAEAKNRREMQELKVARQAFDEYWKIFYVKPILVCIGSKPRTGGGRGR
jgi:hypothetical protein